MQLMDTPDNKEKLVDAIKIFYDNVMEQKDLRHFFFGMNIEKLVKDIELYQDFFMPKPDRYFRETFSQTAPSAIQIKAPQFDELQITLQTSLRSGGYLKSQIPVLSAKLLEMFEESRAQMADENIKVWKPLEVTNQLVADLYNANRTDARLEKNGDVYGSRGFMYPFWTRVANDTKQLIFIGQGFSTSVDTPLETVEAFCKQVNEKSCFRAAVVWAVRVQSMVFSTCVHLPPTSMHGKSAAQQVGILKTACLITSVPRLGKMEKIQKEAMTVRSK